MCSFGCLVGDRRFVVRQRQPGQIQRCRLDPPPVAVTFDLGPRCGRLVLEQVAVGHEQGLSQRVDAFAAFGADGLLEQPVEANQVDLDL